MSTMARSRTTPRARAARRAAARRRLAVLVGAVVLLAAGASALLPRVDEAVQEVTLPLRHDDIIRQQAADKKLDPALIAAVIYAESHFRDQTSHAGARGLMQVTPETAQEIASKSGGTQFTQADLATPQVNIAYGSWYLRWLLQHYGGNETLAIAAYNAGTGNVDKWIARDPALSAADIPFPETRHYVAKVLGAREDYRREYRSELGL
jgi:soluble lytic murein transglycosylase